MATLPTGPTPRPVHVAVLTVSDTRTAANDTSGDFLVQSLQEAGHTLVARAITLDTVDLIQSQIGAWIARGVEVIVTTGGTGITGRDVTIEAISPLFDKRVDGFGELFRHLSYYDVGPSTMQSRAVAGIVGGTWVFAVPGSTGACRLAWEGILRHQLDIRAKPCNLVSLLPRMQEGAPDRC